MGRPPRPPGDPRGGHAGAVPVVDVDHRHPGRAGVEHREQGRETFERGAVADRRRHRHDRYADQATHHARQRALHAGDHDHAVRGGQPVAHGEHPVQAGDPDVGHQLGGRTVGRDRHQGLPRDGQVAGAGRDHDDVTVRLRQRPQRWRCGPPGRASAAAMGGGHRRERRVVQPGGEDGPVGVGLVQRTQDLHDLLRRLALPEDDLGVAGAAGPVDVEARVGALEHPGGVITLRIGHRSNPSDHLGSAAMTSTSLVRLLDALADHPRRIIACSGGVDSLLLADVAHQAAPGTTIVAHSVTPAVPRAATERVRRTADALGWQLRLVESAELSDDRYLTNPVDRCFFCKTNLYDELDRIVSDLEPDASWTLMSGANVDDLGEYRPGLLAAADHHVRHPFVEAGHRQARHPLARRRTGPRLARPAGRALPRQPPLHRHPGHSRPAACGRGGRDRRPAPHRAGGAALPGARRGGRGRGAGRRPGVGDPRRARRRAGRDARARPPPRPDRARPRALRPRPRLRPALNRVDPSETCESDGSVAHCGARCDISAATSRTSGGDFGGQRRRRARAQHHRHQQRATTHQPPPHGVVAGARQQVRLRLGHVDRHVVEVAHLARGQRRRSWPAAAAAAAPRAAG